MGAIDKHDEQNADQEEGAERYKSKRPEPGAAFRKLPFAYNVPF